MILIQQEAQMNFIWMWRTKRHLFATVVVYTKFMFMALSPSAEKPDSDSSIPSHQQQQTNNNSQVPTTRHENANPMLFIFFPSDSFAVIAYPIASNANEKQNTDRRFVFVYFK